MTKILRADKTQTPLTAEEWKLLRKMVGLKNAKKLLAPDPNALHECAGCTERIPETMFYCGLCAGHANYGYDRSA